MIARGSEIWLYGSYARGDFDERSDIDVLVVGPHTPDMLTTLSRRFGHRLSVSAYTWEEIAKMKKDGSLFLLHLHREGRFLESSSGEESLLAGQLEALPSYRHVVRDLRSFVEAVDDVAESISFDFSLAFELSILATVFRHASVLGCYVIGQPTFGRNRPVLTFGCHAGLDKKLMNQILGLYEFRLESARGSGLLDGFEWDQSSVEEWINTAYCYLELVKEQVNVYTEPVS